MPIQPIKSNLASLLALARCELKKLAKSLSPEERSEPGTYARGSAKDNIAHSVEWIHYSSIQINAVLQGQTVTSTADLEAANRQIYDSHHTQSWDEVLRLVNSAYCEMLDILEKTDEKTLTDFTVAAVEEGTPLWRTILGAAFIHPLDHCASYLMEHGFSKKALELEETIFNQTTALDDTPVWIGIAQYNLACYYARAGQPEKALQILPEALLLAPNLKEWSRQDPDLISIRPQLP